MIQKSWFDSLMKLGLRKQHSWLANLPSKIEYIANFGCWSGGEPFSLIWTLDAKEVMVVEIEQKNLKELFKEHDIVRSRYPESLQERTIKTVCRDMTKPLPELPNQHYDLAYCENVLYSQTAVSIELLEEYNDDDDLPCKKALMTSSEEGVAYYIYVCRQEDGSDQVSLQSDLPSVLRQKQ